MTALGAGVGAFGAWFFGLEFSFTIPGISSISGSGAAAMSAGGITVTLSGIQVLTATGILGLTYMLSKSEPIFQNKPPVSWTNNQEGIDAMTEFNKDLNEATKSILKKHNRKMNTGPKTDFNKIKKWLDRVIRKMM